VDFGKKKETNLSARQKKMYTSAEELDTNTVIVVELGNEPFLFVKVLWTAGKAVSVSKGSSGSELLLFSFSLLSPLVHPILLTRKTGAQRLSLVVVGESAVTAAPFYTAVDTPAEAAWSVCHMLDVCVYISLNLTARSCTLAFSLDLMLLSFSGGVHPSCGSSTSAFYAFLQKQQIG
jgi:hypothetical protein